MSHPLFEYRQKYSISQQELADKAGVSQGYIAHIENDIRTPSPRVAERIEAATNNEVSRYVLLYPPKRHSSATEDAAA